MSSIQALPKKLASFLTFLFLTCFLPLQAQEFPKNQAKKAEPVLISSSAQLAFFFELISETTEEEMNDEQKQQIADNLDQDSSGLFSPFIYLEGSFPRQRLQLEIQETVAIAEAATGGAPLPAIFANNFQAAQEDGAPKELLILLSRFSKMIRQQIAHGLEAHQEQAN